MKIYLSPLHNRKSISSSRGVAIVEAAFSLIVVMSLIFGLYGYAQLVLDKARWGNILIKDFNELVLKLRDAEEVKEAVEQGGKYYCTGESDVPRCATIEVPDCEPSKPRGCIVEPLEVHQEGMPAYFTLEATVRVPCVFCKLFTDKNYIVMAITANRVG